MLNRWFGLPWVMSLLSLPVAAQAQELDQRVDRAGEAAVAAELDGERPTSRERDRTSRERDRTPRARDRTPRARKQSLPREPPSRGRSFRRKKPISLGMLLGYGVPLDDIGVNPWGVGFGARGGYNVGAIFLGGRFVFYLGEDPSNIWELGLEAGYDVRAGALSLRPGFGFGLANFIVDAPGVDSTTDAYVAPGLSLLVDLSRDVYAGVDGRVQFILAEAGGFEAIVVLGNLGMRF